jgi:hypothetical protein
MNAVLDCPERFSPAHSSEIEVIILYEDFLSGARAKHFAERLAEGLGSKCPLSQSMWRSDLLDCPSIAMEAASAAADCEYLIVSLRGDRVLSSATRGWIEEQVERAPSRLSCLIALLDSGDGTRRVLDRNRHYLRRVCAANRVEFCAHARMPSAVTTAANSRGSMKGFEVEFSVRRGLPAPLDD